MLPRFAAHARARAKSLFTMHRKNILELRTYVHTSRLKLRTPASRPLDREPETPTAQPKSPETRTTEPRVTQINNTNE